MPRIGIFGGSFDPIHHGHLILADTCREHLRLDRILLIPAAKSPFKPRGPVASNEHRLEMCQLAVSDSPGIEIDPIELERGGTSFTVDTVVAVKRREGPSTEVFLLIGSDSLTDFERWREPTKLLNQVRLAVVQRAGGQPIDFSSVRLLLDEKDRGTFQPMVVPMPNIELSSSELRRRRASGNSIRFRVPREVESYIHTHQLYRTDGCPAHPEG